MKITYVAQHLSRFTFLTTDHMPALTSISRKVFDLLHERPLLSLEIKSADNVIALLSAEKGYHVFLTPILREDLYPKAEGLVCELVDKKVTMQKVKKWDEVEIVAVRIQVKPLCAGRVKTIEKTALGQGVKVDVERAVKCDIS
jgi:hypothetical protein